MGRETCNVTLTATEIMPLRQVEIAQRSTGRLQFVRDEDIRDEVFVSINGKRTYLWRAVDSGGEGYSASGRPDQRNVTSQPTPPSTTASTRNAI